MFSKLRRLFSHFYTVPWCVPAWGLRELRATLSCILRGKITRGPCPDRFADAVRMYLGMHYALPLGRGRVAIEVALRAMGIGKDDEVVTPSYVCASVEEAVVRAGGRVVFADVGPDLHVTPETVRAAMSPRTKCVIVPHLFGNTAPIDAIERMLQGTGVDLIDDAAQSFGARRSGRLAGTFGRCGIVSVGPAKTLAGTAGGVLVTNDSRLYERAKALPLEHEPARDVAARVLSFWVWRRLRKYTLPLEICLNRIFKPRGDRPYVSCGMSNLEGAIGMCQFERLEENLLARRRNAARTLRALGSLGKYNITDVSHAGMVLKLVLVMPENGPAASEILTALACGGIEGQGGYAPLHLRAKNPARPLKATETLFGSVIWVPVDVWYHAGKAHLWPPRARPRTKPQTHKDAACLKTETP